MSEEGRALLTLGEAARRLRVHENTLRKWADEGRVPVVRRPGGGGYRKFEASVIERLRREMGLSD